MQENETDEAELMELRGSIEVPISFPPDAQRRKDHSPLWRPESGSLRQALAPHLVPLSGRLGFRPRSYWELV